MKKYSIYADTSVFGGCFDVEFEKESKKLFAEVTEGKFALVISTTTLRELHKAPQRVQMVLSELPPQFIEFIEFTEEIGFLRDKYLEAGILSPSSISDAEHIATASVAQVDFVVSWNFKHIVHFEKIQSFQAVNLLYGYKPINIYSPKEVVEL
ncbi:MAG: PIN domain protein [Ignavibacteriae bacterium]|nr:PIN domain protein [Ignavibacteriota bacterium]